MVNLGLRTMRPISSVNQDDDRLQIGSRNGAIPMAATEDLSTKSQQTDPERVLFDLMRYWATFWGSLCSAFGWSTSFSTGWAYRRAFIVILLVITPVIFLLTMKRMSDGGGSPSLRCDLIGDRHARGIPASCPQELIV
jgi:hypothetical protein